MMQGSKTMERTPDLDVGVIYTSERPWMRRLLSTLRGSCGNLDVRVLMVDNCSRDGAEQWTDVFPRMQIVPNRERLLYAANLNRILEASTAPFVLLLNTDVYFDPEESCLAKMVDFMHRHPRCGISGCRVHHEDGSYAYPARRFQTLPIIVSRRLGLSRLMPGTINHYFYRDHGMLDQWQCDWLSGCFMLVRREALAQVGPFDVRFPKYFEDVDMCLRMGRAGWDAMYNGQTYCYHLEIRASKRLLSADAWRHARSYLVWLRKWGFSPQATPAAQPRAA
jgi:GT2 family glycosyltransferase